jgi:flagellar biosynthesis anti-sigma factor FlgM
MDTSNNLDAVRSLLGVNAATAKAQPAKSGAATAANAELGADKATLSEAGSGAAFLSSDSDVRADKVAAVKSAIDSGGYQTPASAVAAKVVDAMLGKGNSI